MTDQKTQGCAMCDPELVKPVDGAIAERREKLAETLHIVQINGGYHIMQIPGPDGETLHHLAGAFVSAECLQILRPRGRNPADHPASRRR